MKKSFAVIVVSMLLLGACNGNEEEVKADTTSGNEQTTVTENNSENESTENMDEKQQELIANFKVENLTDIPEYFKLYGYSAEIFSDKYAGQIGAEKGVGVEIDGEVMEVYKFDSSDSYSLGELEDIKETGTLLGNDAIFNGNFVMIGYDSHPNSELIKEIFESFNGGK